MANLNIAATNIYLPEKYRILSSELDRRLGLTEGTVEKRSGISSRYIFPLDVSQSDAMAQCILDMCKKDGIDINSIDLVLCANAVPEQALPNTATAVISKLGVNVAGLDVNMSCLSFISALQLASAFLSTNQYKNIVIVSSDMPHKCLNFNDPESSYIFGDGCTSILLSSEQGNKFNNIKMLDVKFQTFAEYRDYCQIKIGGTLRNINTGYSEEDFYFKMDGKKLFKSICQHTDEFLLPFFEKNNLSPKDFKYVIPHQASHLGMAHMSKKLGFDEDQFINIYSMHGNQVGSSLPTVLNTVLQNKHLESGDKLLIVGTGAGLTIGAALMEI